MSKIFRVIISDKRPCTVLLLILRMYFHVFNFNMRQAVRKYFNNEIFVIYGSTLNVLEKSLLTDDTIDNVRASG